MPIRTRRDITQALSKAAALRQKFFFDSFFFQEKRMSAVRESHLHDFLPGLLAGGDGLDVEHGAVPLVRVPVLHPGLRPDLHPGSLGDRKSVV